MMAFINREQSVDQSLAAIEGDEFGTTVPLLFLAHARTLAAEVRRLRIAPTLDRQTPRERELEQAWRAMRDDVNNALSALTEAGFPPVESDGIAITLRRFLARQSVRASGDADRLGFLADRFSDLVPRLRKIAAELGDSWPTTQDETSTAGDEDATTSDENGTSSR